MRLWYKSPSAVRWLWEWRKRERHLGLERNSLGEEIQWPTSSQWVNKEEHLSHKSVAEPLASQCSFRGRKNLPSESVCWILAIRLCSYHYLQRQTLCVLQKGNRSHLNFQTNKICPFALWHHIQKFFSHVIIRLKNLVKVMPGKKHRGLYRLILCEIGYAQILTDGDFLMVLTDLRTLKTSSSDVSKHIYISYIL